METVNIRGAINCLEVNEKVRLPKSLCTVSTVRSAAGSVTADTGKRFGVSAIEDENDIIVIRKS